MSQPRSLIIGILLTTAMAVAGCTGEGDLDNCPEETSTAGGDGNMTFEPSPTNASYASMGFSEERQDAQANASAEAEVGEECPEESPSYSPFPTGNETHDMNHTTSGKDPNMEITEYPETASAGEAIMVSWRVEQAENATLPVTSGTAVYWSTTSVPDPTSTTEYEDGTDPQPGVLPTDFSGEFTVESDGMLYVRAHAEIQGEDYWSQEVMIMVGSTGNGTLPA
jgi:hypothetical protein